MEKRLREAGADQLATTLHDSRAQIIPLLQVAVNTTPAENNVREPEGVMVSDAS